MLRTEIMDAYMTEKQLLQLVPPCKVSEHEPQAGFNNWAVPLTKSARLFFNGKNGHLYLQVDHRKGERK